ncbi:unnamed protein product [Notodromas monacha]|uniref:WW domain-containing protein n=1 Tax=Notodromas monacha TaxID=399045 RepID=A0A7R9BXH5_9CRUS|nr:unnamed protein product [Notodromas monacha]CAG0922033.1 unnamed protein product [Notodromas monacha]
MMEEPALAKSEASQRFEVGEEDLSPPEFNDEDLKEYSKRIGIDWETEQHLAHIAVEGLSSRLPTGWKPCFDTERDRWFYFNASCGTSQWEHPLDSHFRRLVQEAREGRVVVGGLKDTSVSTSSQVDTCFDVNEIDEADSVIVDVAESSEEVCRIMCVIRTTL